jgi:polyketide-type polyunsaturated fatty acid synthase PfaA
VSTGAIAVVGLSTLLPESADLTTFWENVREARDCFTDVPVSHWRIEDYFDPTPRAKDKTYGKRGGFIPKVPFDSLKFGLPPSALPSTDVSQILALLVAQRCLADADHGMPERFDRKRTSVILGASATTALLSHMSGRMARPMWRAGLLAAGFDEDTVDAACSAIADQFVGWQESTFPGLLGNVIAGRIANRFDLGGTNCVLDAACASSLAALAMAIEELRSGRADTVLSGGVDALNDILMYMCFSQTPALSLTGDCRPFSDRADGTMMGEGLAMFALRRLEDAERDGHKIYAILRGMGSSSDGRAKSVYAPRPEGQMLALRRAYEDAGYGPETVELVEAHGTGTVAGDAAEFAALHEVFAAADPSRTQWVALGSVKSQIGHTKSAAGAASLAKVILSLQHRTLPPTLKVERPNPSLQLASTPFYLSTTTRPWFQRQTHPRRASVSSFGFGGSNFHVTVEEYCGPSPAPRTAGAPTYLILLAGTDDPAILAASASVADRLQSADQLAAYARASQMTFDAAAPVRVALLVSDYEEVSSIVTEMREALATGTALHRTPRVLVRRGAPFAPREVAFVFPGQGSQYVGMGCDLAVHFPDAFEAWQHAVSRIRDGVVDLGERVFPRPVFDDDSRRELDRRLRATEWAQPALAAASLAQLALLDKIGLRPHAALGHSFGELVALHASGAFCAGTLLDLARARGLAMAACAPDVAGTAADAGAMLAVSADIQTVRNLLDRSGETTVVVANDNHPKQVVLSGPSTAVTAFATVLTTAGLSHQRLPVAAAFHSPLVVGAATQFARTLQETNLAAPAFPVIANTSATSYTSDVNELRTQLTAQLAQPVRFREGVETLYASGCRVFVEVGAGTVLSGLIRKCLSDRAHTVVSLDNPAAHGVTAWWTAMAELATLGLPMNLAALHHVTTPFDAVPAPATGATVTAVGGANLGKPYPPPAASETLGVPAPVRPVGPAPTTASPSPAIEVANDGPPPSLERLDDSDFDIAQSLYETSAPMTEFVQSQILEAQRLTQQAILESFAMTLRGMGGGAEGVPALTAQPVMRMLPGTAPALTAPVTAPAPTVTPQPNLEPAPVASTPAPSGPNAAAAPTVVRQSATTAHSAEAPVPTHAAATADVVLRVIAASTGYPIEALAPDMELEADLGIDSIKRVEILAALADKVAGLDAQSADPAKIRRVKDLLGLLEGSPAGPQ